jgi:hypothetical protein
MMEYFEGSSSEVNSPVSLGEVQKGKIAGGDETMENFTVGVQLEDLTICLDDISDKSTDTWKTGLELSEDDNMIFSSFNSNFGKQCQVLAIIGDNSEEFDENNNPVLNPANISRGANHLAEGQTPESLTTREKVRLSADEWRIIREAVENGTSIPSKSKGLSRTSYMSSIGISMWEIIRISRRAQNSSATFHFTANYSNTIMKLDEQENSAYVQVFMPD